MSPYVVDMIGFKKFDLFGCRWPQVICVTPIYRENTMDVVCQGKLACINLVAFLAPDTT